MKYLLINSVAGLGSTGRIAADQCRALCAEGHECLLAYGTDIKNCDDIDTLAITAPQNYRIHWWYSMFFDRHGFASRRATKRFLQQVDAYNPDVIWLHNIHGYYLNIELLFAYLKQSGKSVYWTLHDCWPFTGHCAHFDAIGCEKWRTGCTVPCPETHNYPKSIGLDNCARNFADKKRIFTGVPNLTLVVPSAWLGGLAKESFLGEYPVQVVHNTIDEDIFKPTVSDFRQKHGLTDKKTLLSVASVWTQRKGFDDCLRLAKELPADCRLVMVGLSEEQLATLPSTILGIARTANPTELAQIYTAADAFINPTYEDNYPTVNLEAQACGTPVITYDAGGAKETLRLSTCQLVPRGDFAGLLNAAQTVQKKQEA